MQMYQGKHTENRHSSRKGVWSNAKFIVIAIAAIFAAGFIVIAAAVIIMMAKLPKVDRLADYKPPIVSQVFGDDGSLVGEFYLERRTVVPVNKIPRKLIQAFVAAEDANFFQHKGIDYFGILRAAAKNIMKLRKKEGASTITQQVAKSMLLTPERTFSRKIKEAILAVRMEKKLTKDEILYIYLNQIYLGAGAYGVQLAAETYFGKEVENLNLAEMAILAGLPKAPSSYSPIKHMEKAKERQAYVLDRMIKEGYITQAEAEHAQKTPIVIKSLKKINSDQSAYFLEHIRIQMEEKYGEDKLYKEGLKIYTTMNAEMQKAAYEAVVKGLKEVDKRQGFRGPLKFLPENGIDAFCKQVEEGIDGPSLKQGTTYQGVVTAINTTRGDMNVRVGERFGILPKKNMAWAGKVKLADTFGKQDDKGKGISRGAVIEVSVTTADQNKTGAVFSLDQTPEAQAALVAVDPRTGGVKALIGGYDFKKSQFNRAIQAKRNPGSAFKPIIYGAAIDKGLMNPASIIEDSPIEYDGGRWKPKNYDGVYRGNVTMREALTSSINIVSVKILETIGVGTAVDFAKKLGIISPLSPNLTLALGSSSLSPLELTSAYAVYASGGYRTTPYFVTKVLDGSGKVLEEITTPQIPVFTSSTSAALAPPQNPIPAIPGLITTTPLVNPLAPVQVISPETAFIMTNLMESVVTSGTGQRARAVGRPVAGKTGTTNDMKDAWFVGFVPQLAAGVWVGYDQEKSLGAGGSGGQASAPIWTEFMQRSLALIPTENFKQPSNITFALINPRTGKLAREGSEGAIMECFITGTEPTVYDGDRH